MTPESFLHMTDGGLCHKRITAVEWYILSYHYAIADIEINDNKEFSGYVLWRCIDFESACRQPFNELVNGHAIENSRL